MDKPISAGVNECKKEINTENIEKKYRKYRKLQGWLGLRNEYFLNVCDVYVLIKQYKCKLYIVQKKINTIIIQQQKTTNNKNNTTYIQLLNLHKIT